MQIQKVSDESVLEQIEKILRRMDDDRDESLKVEDVLKVRITILFFKLIKLTLIILR